MIDSKTAKDLTVPFNVFVPFHAIYLENIFNYVLGRVNVTVFVRTIFERTS